MNKPPSAAKRKGARDCARVRYVLGRWTDREFSTTTMRWAMALRCPVLGLSIASKPSKNLQSESSKVAVT